MPEADPILSRNAPLGPYTILKKLGEGGMGGVYLGEHKVLQVYHAIKVVHARMTSDPQLIERFFREARHAAKLTHPNIVQTVGADVVDGTYYLAMQYVEGKTLGQMAKSGAMNMHQAVRYVHMIANALAYAHGRKVIHRDIKPANIMVDADDTAKLMDFGLVRDMSQGQQPEQQPQLTMAGFIVGTPQYMPPEQWHGEGVDHRSDIYSLGVTLYHLLSGWYPYNGRTTADIFRAVMAGKPTPLRMKAPSVDENLAAIIEKAAGAQQDDRYQSAQEFAMALDEWWQSNPPEANTSLMRVPVQEPGASSLATTGPRSGRTTITPDLATRTPARTSAGRTVSGTRAAPGGGGDGGEDRGAMEEAADDNGGSGPPAASSPTILQAPASNKTVLIAVGAIALVLAVIGIAVVMVLGNRGEQNKPADGGIKPPELLFAVDIPADQGLEANPIYVASLDYSIPGSSNGDVKVNSEPYKFGNAYRLAKGAQKLTIEAALAGASSQAPPRTLWIIADPDAPELAIAAITDAVDNHGSEIAIEETSYRLTGTVTEKLTDVKVQVLAGDDKIDATLSGKPESGANFEVVIPVGNDKIKVEVVATDRAGNSTKSPLVWIVPERDAVAVDWGGLNPDKTLRVSSKKLRLEGKVGKQRRGLTLTYNGTPLKIDQNGVFVLEAELEEGSHVIEIQAKGRIGRPVTVKREVIVDLHAPDFSELKPTVGETFRFEKLPARVRVSGKLDDPDAKLTCGGAKVIVGVDGSFSVDAEATAFGDLTVSLVAQDFANRVSTAELKYAVKELRYRELAKNGQGYREFQRLKDGMVMVEIPAGVFMQGTTDAKLVDAQQRKCKLSTYLIAKYETTNEQYCKFLNDRKITEDAARKLFVTSDPEAAKVYSEGAEKGDAKGGRFCIEFAGGQWMPMAGAERRAVVGVTWQGAQEYCQWADADGSLPSEAQWEYAARGADGRAYPWGNDESIGADRAHYRSSGLETEALVVDTCKKEGFSPFGVFNMAGNVEEWCADWYAVTTYGKGEQQDPKVTDKPADGDRRVTRGGSFRSAKPTELKMPGMTDADTGDLRTFVRQRRLPQSGAFDRGFRAAAPAPK
ncbi:MAG: SUMF1/EgtB/PvdO family nonheme iron enzyme [Planctomycetes bacterium]|nr:SUMF1/EgtB/PvdO family nonheme iron enzyme [Planctomycetota bacterium]